MNTEDIRKLFPALERIHHGLPVAYFDAPGGTQVPRQVVDAMADTMFHHNANTRWPYPTSEEIDEIIWTSRQAAGDLLNADPREIVFGANMTTLTFHLARTLARTWREGDEVIVTELDHHANVAPWRALEVERGIVVRTARMIPETAQLDYDHLGSLVTARTRLIAIGGASNVTGTINDVSRISVLSKAAGALLFVDAVHLVPHELIDVRAMGCDFLACSAYKFYGPHVGILFARHELLESLPFPKLAPAPDSAPERAETGTQNHEGIAAIRATIDFMGSLGVSDPETPGPADAAGRDGPGDMTTRREGLRIFYSAAHEESDRLVRIFQDEISASPRVRIFGPPPSASRTPTLSFTVAGLDCDDLARRLAHKALFASSGDFYASSVCERYGIESLLRVGFACYTTEEEVMRLVEAIGSL